MSTSHLPPEIWTEILKEAISVPLFLDANPLQNHQPGKLQEYFYELPYWQSERVRNSLRRVCDGWNEFLKQFDNRYVRLIDVYHERIAKDAIRRAIRSDTSVDWDCRCEAHCRTPGRFGPRYRNRNRVAQMIRDAINEDPNQAFGHWRLRILNIDLVLEQELINSIKRYAPNLGSIFGFYASFSFLSNRLYTFISGGQPESYHVSNQPLLTFSHLTTLSLQIIDLSFPFQTSEIPSLRYLHLYSVEKDGHDDPMTGIEAILKAAGQNLHTFILVHPRIYQPISDNVWQLTPKLEVIELPCHWTRGPPTSHPLRTIRVSFRTLRKDKEALDGDCSPRTKEFIPGMVSDSWFRSSGLEVRSSTLWKDMIFQSHRLSPALWFTKYYPSIKVKFFDAEGVTFNEYIVFLISAYWKGGQGNRRFPKTTIFAPLFYRSYNS